MGVLMEHTDFAAQLRLPARGYMQVANALRREIARLGVGEGDRLPSERDLARLLEISRPTLREALVVLEVQGEIEIRVGSGIYLKHAAPGAAPPHHDEPDALGHSPKDVHQTRYFLEGGLAAHAARFISRKQLRVLAASVDAMRKALLTRDRTGDRPIADADRLFHVTLASTADNRLLTQTLEELFDQRYTPLGGSLHRLFDNAAVWQDAIEEHQEVCDAVADRDPLQAQAAMQRHLRRAHARLMAVIG